MIQHVVLQTTFRFHMGCNRFFDWDLQASPWEGEGACSERMAPCTDALCSAVKIPSGAEGFTTNFGVNSTGPLPWRRQFLLREDVASGYFSIGCCKDTFGGRRVHNQLSFGIYRPTPSTEKGFLQKGRLSLMIQDGVL